MSTQLPPQWGQPGYNQPVPPGNPPPQPKPFYRKVWFWLLVGFLLFMGGCTALVVGAASSIDTATEPTTVDGISKGAGSADASGDVRIVSLGQPDAIGIRNGVLEVTNHSKGRSDYYIELTVLDASGTNIGMANASVDSLNPGQKARATFHVTEDDAAKVEINEIQRTASL
jgi:hypothetical protein